MIIQIENEKLPHLHAQMTLFLVSSDGVSLPLFLFKLSIQRVCIVACELRGQYLFSLTYRGVRVL